MLKKLLKSSVVLTVSLCFSLDLDKEHRLADSHVLVLQL